MPAHAARSIEAIANNANSLSSLVFISSSKLINGSGPIQAWQFVFLLHLLVGNINSSCDGLDIVDADMHPHDSRMTNSVRIRVNASASSPFIKRAN
jgi:hypothetical protein